MEKEPKIFESVDQFILQSQAVPELSSRERLQLLASAAEMWRRVPDTCRALMQKILDVFSRTNLSHIPFSVSDEIFSNECFEAVASAGIPKEDVFDILLNALQIFLDAVQKGEMPDKALLLAIIREVARAAAAAYKKPLKAELYSERLVSRTFKTSKPGISTFHELGIRYVSYQPEVAPGVYGHDIRGLAFVPRSDLPPAKRPFAENQLFVLLESGEHVILPDNLINLAGMNDAEEYDRMPDILLLQAYLAAPLMYRMGVLSKEQVETIQSKFGTITCPYVAATGDVNAILPLEQVFIRGAERAASPTTALSNITGPSGAVVRFPVSAGGEDCAVILNARLTPTGYYLVSSLVQANGDADDVLLMKNDYPRQLSPYGIYVFPREQALYALLVFPHHFVFSSDV